MGREWELSYRLGMRKNKKLFCFASHACPEGSKKSFSNRANCQGIVLKQVLYSQIQKYFMILLNAGKKKEETSISNL